ncbi:MAG: DNA recombination protein RmuC [Oscillospiraceae bacterium]|nr:DNA recombination protein RmuC [Oscillospiraceae bacterium]
MLDAVERQLKENGSSQKELQSRIAAGQRATFSEFSNKTNDSLYSLQKNLVSMVDSLDRRFVRFQKQTNEQTRSMRQSMDARMNEMIAGNEKKLEEMRMTVDEKLQKTLEDRISQSFKTVSERLEQVYQSLGEMQKVGQGVDDLKKVLSNVKTRGILGEVQLGAILEEILSPEQYDTNVVTKKGSTDRVEYAVKMPGMEGETVYLPIDAKFPLDAYGKLMDAYDAADSRMISQASKELRGRIIGFARDIRTKYIDVPNTTEFAIMFLPTEGLYAEVVRMGLVEELQKDKINIAGPTTMAALLNSLQMGFRTLAIQKSSGRVWQVLGEVKTEFSKFGDALDAAQNRMRQTSEELDKLVGVRTRAINRKLREVESYSSDAIPDMTAGLLDQ